MDQAYRIPLVIGVTSQKSVPGPPADLRRRVRAILTELRGCEDRRGLRRWTRRRGALRLRLPHTPFVLLCPMLTDADRMVAEVAYVELGARVLVPRAPEDPSASEGRLRWWTGPADTSFDRTAVGDAAQWWAGAFVARHAQVLLAVWDGHVRQSAGGRSLRAARPSSIVEMNRSGHLADCADARRHLESLPSNPFEGEGRLGERVRGMTLRIWHDLSDGTGRELPYVALHPKGSDATARERRCYEAHLRDTFEGIDRFNRESSRAASGLAAEVRERGDRLLGARRTELLDGVDATRLSVDLRHALTSASVAAALADRSRRRMIVGTVALRAAIALAALLFLGYASYYGAEESGILWRGLVGFVVTAGIAAAVRPAVRRRRFLDRRALAEVLRVQLCWRLAGMSDRAADSWLVRHRGSLDWIVRAAEAWSLSETGDSPARLDVIRESFIERGRKEASEQRLRGERGALLSSALAGLGWITSAAFALVLMLPSVGFDAGYWAGPYFVVGAGLIALLGMAARSFGRGLRGLLEAGERRRDAALFLLLTYGTAFLVHVLVIGGLTLSIDLRVWFSVLLLVPFGIPMIAIALPAVVAVLVDGFSRDMAWREEAASATRARRVFVRSADELRRITARAGEAPSGEALADEEQDDAVRELLRSLGRELLAENEDRLLRRRGDVRELT